RGGEEGDAGRGGSSEGPGGWVATAKGDRQERGVAVGARDLRLAADPEPPRAGQPGGVDAVALRQRPDAAGAPDQQGGGTAGGGEGRQRARAREASSKG